MAKKQNEVKICLWTHVQDEEHIIKDMLQSAVDYIDYWVLIDNGSKDSTPEIIEKFFKEHNVEGKLYHSEIGWKGHGVNRQHSWDFLTSTNHGCDYILRIDADEKLVVEDNFNWSEIKEKEAWNVLYRTANHCVRRLWLWDASLPWFWKDDVAHETIHLPNDRTPNSGNLPDGLTHTNNPKQGQSYQNPIKYLQDVLKLENQLLERFRDGASLPEEEYHLTYLAKSFNYIGMNVEVENNWKYFPYGKANLENFLRRGIFYWTQHLEQFGGNWYSYWQRAQLFVLLNDHSEAKQDWLTSYKKNPTRAEPIFNLFMHCFENQEWDEAYKYGNLLINIKCPYPQDSYFVEFDKYHENNYRIADKLSIACHQFGMKYNIVDAVVFAKRLVNTAFSLHDIPNRDKSRMEDNIKYFDKYINKFTDEKEKE